MHTRTCLIAAVLALTSSTALANRAKNVILMISDGAGPTTWQAANQWQFGTNAGSGSAFKQRFEQADFTQHWMTTFPGNTLPLPPGQTDVRLGFPAGTFPRYLPQLWNELPIPDAGTYDPARANDPTPADVRLFANSSGTLLGDRGPRLDLTPVATNPPAVQQLANILEANGTVRAHVDQGFAAYDYLIWNSTTDSAAAGTALASGRKTYNSAINYVDNGTSLEAVPFITQQVKAMGMKAGVVTTKPFTDATPAAFGTQDDYRDDEAAISDSMIRNGLLDVIITPGHPEFGGSSQTLSASNLAALRGGLDGWSFVDDNATLRGIGDATVEAPDRLFGMVPVGGSLNSRNTAGRTNAYDPRFFDPANPNGAVPFVSPDLDELSLAALRTLSKGDNGFFAMIEGASVDSAAHANNLPQLIEEQLQFNRAVDAVINWVETNSNWEETLLIVTTDHANGLLLGPDSDTIFFQDPIATSVGNLPQAMWWTTNHTNELVPLWTKGAGADLFGGLVDGIDPRRGQYIDNTDVYNVMSRVIIPEPGTLALLAGAMLVLRRR
jgi:alkaline phosphatase